MKVPKTAVFGFLLQSPRTALSQTLGMRLLKNNNNGGGNGGENGGGGGSNTSCYSSTCSATSGSQRSELIPGNDTPCIGGTKIEGSLSPVYPATESSHSWTNTLTGVECTVTLSNIM